MIFADSSSGLGECLPGRILLEITGASSSDDLDTSVRSQTGFSAISANGLFVACHAIFKSERDSMFPASAFWKTRIGGAKMKAADAQRKMTIVGGSEE